MEDWKMYNFQNGCDICILQMDINKTKKKFFPCVFSFKSLVLSQNSKLFRRVHLMSSVGQAD